MQRSHHADRHANDAVRAFVARAAGVLAGVSAAGAGASLAPPVQFVETGPAQGVLEYRMLSGFAAGLAAADYDRDGDIDIFVPTDQGRANQLYANLGDGRFSEIATKVGLASTEPARAALWLDFDGDHRLDLLVAGDCFSSPGPPCGTSHLHLYRQLPTGSFRDVTAEVGLDGVLSTEMGQHVGGMCAADLDADGDLDVYLGLWGGGVRLLINDAGARFIDATSASGLADVRDESWQPIVHDFDADGRFDIFAAVDFAPNHLWMNNGDGTFTDRGAQAGVDFAWNDMGVALGDYDNDGDFDLYVTEIYEPFRTHNLLLRNDSVLGSPAFHDVARQAAVDMGGFSWGVTFLDADLDGWLDLAVTNGWSNGIGMMDASRFFRSGGGIEPTFEDASAASGFDDTDWSSGLVAADIDRDGDLDLAHTSHRLRALEPGSGRKDALRIWTNRLPRGDDQPNHLVVRPRMPGRNHWAIGAVVRVRTDELVMSRLLTAGTSMMGQEPAEAHFGLGDSSRAHRVVVEWPDATTTARRDIPANRILDLASDGCCALADLTQDGIVGTLDFFEFLSLFVSGEPAADMDMDGAVSASDLFAFLEMFVAEGSDGPG